MGTTMGGGGYREHKVLREVGCSLSPCPHPGYDNFDFD